MSSIYGVLQVGRQALAAHQEALNVTGHNIANANTPGYTRQRVVLETSAPITTRAGQVGCGVKVREIERVYDQYLTRQINDENETLGRWEAEKGGLERVEAVLNEAPGYGLSQAMSEFWGAWQDLSNNPSGQTERQMLAGAGENLADNFQRIYNDLSQLQTEMNTYVTQTVEEINFKAGQITDINQKIVTIEAGGGNANDCRDERDVFIKELAKMIDLTAAEQNDGMVTITLGDGGKLVEGAASFGLTTLTNASGFDDVAWASDPATSINSSISDGKLKGYLEVRDEEISSYVDKLEALAGTIKDAVNARHTTGFGLDGATGNDFFSGALADNDFGLSTTVLNDTNTIAAASAASGVPGDGSNAISMAELQYSLTMSGNTATFDDYYNSLVSTVGTDVQQATSRYEHQDAMVSYLDNYRESISGVSLDEEMINMLQFETAYEAAAKVINSVDRMIETLMSIV